MYRLERLGTWMTVISALLVALLYGVWTPDLDTVTLEQRYQYAPTQAVEVDGLRIRYKDTGPRDAPAILLLHGFGSSLQTWDAWADSLDKRYRVIRLDLPGFGLTGPSPTNDYSEQTDTETLTRFIDQLGVRQLAVVGHSMGGKMAWSLAASQPARITALVLMAPDGYPRPEDIGTKPYASSSVMHLIKYFLPKYFLEKSLEPAFYDATQLNETLVNRYYDMLRAPGVRAAILARGDQTVYTDPVPRLKRITAPTLLLWGEEDQMIPSRNAQDYERDIPRSTTVLLPQSGHLIQEERPDVGLTAVSHFLDKHLPQ